MSAWLDGEGRFFNPKPSVSSVPLGAGQTCIVIDDALANPEGLRAWATRQFFVPPAGYPYPGLVCEVPGEINARLADHFTLHVRRLLGARRTLSLSVRLSVINTPPEALDPVQWMCHRDRLADEAGKFLFAACVLYLFEDPSLGGTSFYAPRQAAAQTERLVADSQALDAHDYGARYGLRASYMAGSNAYFERIAQVPARWNRVIFYDGSLFHSADVNTARLDAAPATGRLTLNSFITCRRESR